MKKRGFMQGRVLGLSGSQHLVMTDIDKKYREHVDEYQVEIAV